MLFHSLVTHLFHSNQASRGSPVPLLDANSPMEEATVWTLWTLRMTLEAGALTWTWSLSTSTQSIGLLASSYSASFATSSSLHFDNNTERGEFGNIQNEAEVRNFGQSQKPGKDINGETEL